MNLNPQAWDWSEVRKDDKGPKFQEPLSLGTLWKCLWSLVLRMVHINISTARTWSRPSVSFTFHGSFLGFPKFRLWAKKRKDLKTRSQEENWKPETGLYPSPFLCCTLFHKKLGMASETPRNEQHKWRKKLMQTERKKAAARNAHPVGRSVWLLGVGLELPSS